MEPINTPCMSLGPEKKVVSVVLTNELREKLKAVKAQTGCPESETIRRALVEWFAAHPTEGARGKAKRSKR